MVGIFEIRMRVIESAKMDRATRAAVKIRYARGIRTDRENSSISNCSRGTRVHRIFSSLSHSLSLSLFFLSYKV